MEIAVIGSLIAAIGAAIALIHRHTKQARQQRTETLRAYADRNGWGFRDAVPFDGLPDLERFELFRPGRAKKLSNVLTSPRGELRAVVFDYSYTISNGKSEQTVRQTVFYASGEQLALPSFSLRPENFFHRVGAVFGYQDIDLDHRPEFSRMYLLRGEDEERIRDTFSDAVAEFFERRPGACAAGLRRELLFWRAGRTVKTEDVESFVADGYELAQRLQVLRPQP